VRWPGGYEVSAFGGSQFYPFPTPIALYLCRLFPGAALCIFCLLTKSKHYEGEGFLRHPVDAHLETNFFLG
jgi:hypothetical protein